MYLKKVLGHVGFSFLRLLFRKEMYELNKPGEGSDLKK